MQDRIFKTKDTEGNEVVLRFKRPTQAQLAKAELAQRSAFSRAFRMDILTNAEVEKSLLERGLWDDEKRQQAAALRDETDKLAEQLTAGLSNEEGEVICKKIDELRFKLLTHNSVYQNAMDNTCETMAAEERNQLLCVECVVDNKTGAKVFKDVEDLRNKANEQLTVDAFRETVVATLEVAVGRALPSNLADEYPENKWRAEREKVKVTQNESTEDAQGVLSDSGKRAKKKSG
jgi:hypothetical protein